MSQISQVRPCYGIGTGTPRFDTLHSDYAQPPEGAGTRPDFSWLHPVNKAQWLVAGTEEDIRVLLAPLENDVLDTYEVNPEVSAVRVNDKTLMGPLKTR